MLFTISREGVIYLNAPLDRETQDQVCVTASSTSPTPITATPQQKQFGCCVKLNQSHRKHTDLLKVLDYD